MTAPHERVVVVAPPPDCDFSGVWLVVDERPLPGGDSQLRLQQGNSYIGARRSNVRAATQDDVTAPRTTLTDARDLDWSTAKEAAQRIVRISDDAGFTAPELLDVLRDKVQTVCEELNRIVAALKITPPGVRP